MTEPTDSELVRYIMARFKQVGAMFAEPEAVAEALRFNRDLWVQLYDIDREFDPGFVGFANRSYS